MPGAVERRPRRCVNSALTKPGRRRKQALVYGEGKQPKHPTGRVGTSPRVWTGGRAGKECEQVLSGQHSSASGWSRRMVLTPSVPNLEDTVNQANGVK